MVVRKLFGQVDKCLRQMFTHKLAKIYIYIIYQLNYIDISNIVLLTEHLNFSLNASAYLLVIGVSYLLSWICHFTLHIFEQNCLILKVPTFVCFIVPLH